MSFDLFVILILVAVWASLPLCLVISTKTFGDDLGHDPHAHGDGDSKES